jgi:hypothetical protein
MSTPVLVFVPGTLGSELLDDTGRIWPGSLLEAVRGFDGTKFNRLKAAGLKVGDIVRSAAGGLVSIYAPWIKAFEGLRIGNAQLFRENPIAGAPKTLRPFPYDWRADLVATSGTFADFLDDILKDIADADIKLVCHSQGGMLARFFLESGLFDTRAAFSRVSLLATFGTPHNGAPVAFAAAVGMHKTDFLSKQQTKDLAAHPNCPSLYQLFPGDTHSFIWNLTAGAAATPLAADALDVVRRYQLSQANLNKWRAFRAGLTGRRPKHVRYFFVIGSRQETLVRFTWDGQDLQIVELEDGGDGTVSLLGAMDSATQSEFVGKSHVSLIETRQARETFASLLGAQTTFAVGDYSLSVRSTVVDTREPIHVQIECLKPVDQLTATLRFERADIQDEALVPLNPVFAAPSFTPVLPIAVKTIGLEFLNLTSPPIQTRGVYRPVMDVQGEGQVVGPQFVVQQTGS